MSTVTVSSRVGAGVAPTAGFERFAGLSSLLAGVCGFLYAVAFVLLRDQLLAGVFLLLGGLFSTAPVIALYYGLRETDAPFALWGTLLAFVGVIGAAVHGGYDLANLLHPTGTPPFGDLPSQVDPRGLLTFGVGGLGVLTLAWLLVRGGPYPAGLGYLGVVFGVLQVLLYVGRLVVLDAASPLILAPAVLTGFVINPAWYLWLGLVLWRGQPAD